MSLPLALIYFKPELKEQIIKISNGVNLQKILRKINRSIYII